MTSAVIRKCDQAVFIQMLQWIHQQWHCLYAMPLSRLSQRGNLEIGTVGPSPEASSGHPFEHEDKDCSIPSSIPLLLVWLMLSRDITRTLAVPEEGDSLALDNSVAVCSVLVVEPGSTTTLIAPPSTRTVGSVFCNRHKSSNVLYSLNWCNCTDSIGNFKHVQTKLVVH